MYNGVIVKEAMAEVKGAKKGTATILKAFSIIKKMREKGISWDDIAWILSIDYTGDQIKNFYDVAEYFANNPLF